MNFLFWEGERGVGGQGGRERGGGGVEGEGEGEGEEGTKQPCDQVETALDTWIRKQSGPRGQRSDTFKVLFFFLKSNNRVNLDALESLFFF